MYRDGEYKPYTLEEAVKVGKRIYALLLLNNIEVIRVGLQPSEDLRAEGVIIDGPFHPAFRELIEGELYYEFLKGFIGDDGEQDLEVYGNEKNISKIVGNKGVNKVKLGDRFSIKIDNNLSMDEIWVNGNIYSRREILENGIK
jgi:hypothetical protein